MKVAFIGLGIMGSRMAQNLLKNNVDVTVYNKTISKAEELVKHGGKVAKNIADCVSDKDVVFTMLSTPEIVEEVAFGTAGFVHYMSKNAIWADCTTVNPSFSREMATKSLNANIRFLDTPVAGSKLPAQNAELVFLIGGNENDYKEIEPLLNYMGKKNIHAGKNGQGSALKMLINSMLAQSMLVYSETLLLGEKLGFKSNFLLDTLPNLPVIAPFVKQKSEKIRLHDYEVEFPLEWMHKDLYLATKSAYEVNAPQLMANVAKELYGEAKANFLGRKDFSAIYKYLRKKFD